MTYLKSEPQINNERMLKTGEQLDFAQHVAKSVLFDAQCLAAVLHGVHTLCVFLLNNADLEGDATRVVAMSKARIVK